MPPTARHSVPAPREMFVTFNHLHKNLAPVVDESEDSEEERPRKKEAWRKRLHLPDYRKVKIGEYYDEDLDISCSGESDISARSSFESDKSVELKSTAPPPQVICSGCNFNLTPASTPAVTPEAEESGTKQGLRSKKLRLNTLNHTQYRCLWPGCRIILCSACTSLMQKPKLSGGMGGSLEALRRHYQAQEVHSTDSTKATTTTERADGAITADIVQAVTSAPTSPATVKRSNDISETISVVDHVVAAVEGKIVEKAVAEITQKELVQKLDHCKGGERIQPIVIVQELGLVPAPKAS